MIRPLSKRPCWAWSLCWRALAAAAIWQMPAAHAQSNAPATRVLTLHVYQNLIQIPVLVLNDGLRPIDPIAGNRFRVSLDSGPPFRPPHVRAQGDDPIALAVLLVVKDGEDDLLKKMGPVLASFGRTALQGRDRISVYVEDDCAVTRLLFDRPPNSLNEAAAVDSSLRSVWKTTHAKANRGCPRETHLWDALQDVVEQTSTLPGRRVILAITDGDDEHSGVSSISVKTLAIRNGVAIFGLQASEVASFDFNAPSKGREDKFRLLCELTGGLVFTATGHSLGRRLREFAELLRNRYIVEFSRPNGIGVGDHDFLVTVTGLNGFIRPAGISVPVADPKLLDDPDAVKPSPSLAPEMGTRKAMPRPQ